MVFCNIAINQSSVRRLYDSIKAKGISLTREAMEEFSKKLLVKDEYYKLVYDTINNYKNFVLDEHSCIKKVHSAQITALIYSSLIYRCGQPVEMMRLTSALASLTLNKRLIALGYDQTKIQSLNIKIQPLASVQPVCYYTTKIIFTINHEMHSYIIDSFLNQVFKTDDMSDIYEKYGSECLIPKDINFFIEPNMFILIKEQQFLQTFEKMIQSIFGIDLSVTNVSNPFKNMVVPSQGEIKNILRKVSLASPVFLEHDSFIKDLKKEAKSENSLEPEDQGSTLQSERAKGSVFSRTRISSHKTI